MHTFPGRGNPLPGKDFLSNWEGTLTGLYFTSAPNRDESYAVGDKIEVYCDHDHNGERIRDWLEGTVVQVDPKLIAIQFQENVYLTDGWMVPDHVLWCPKDSNNIRRVIHRRRRARPIKVNSGDKE
jgi:hypothetical protein